MVRELACWWCVTGVDVLLVLLRWWRWCAGGVGVLVVTELVFQWLYTGCVNGR